jgi:hypothetical protein
MSDTALAERKINRDIADTIEVGKGGINFQNAGELMEFARMMSASGSAVPKHLRGQPGACLGILDDAVRFGVNPYALGRQSYFVNDQLAYQAQVFMAIINAHAPLKTRPDIRYEGEGQEMRATVTGTFRDGAEREYKSPRIADIQPKNSPLWKSDPGQQLAYYSLRAFARRWCPEVIMGIHDVDELREAAMTDVTPKPVADAPAKAKAIPRSLDEFAAGSSSPSSPLEEEPAAGGTEPTSGSAPAGAANPLPAASAGIASELDAKASAIAWLVDLAGDKELTAEDKLEQLDLRRPVVAETVPAAFLDEAIAAAAKWIRGELKPAAARKYLEGL